MFIGRGSCGRQGLMAFSIPFQSPREKCALAGAKSVLAHMRQNQLA